ncbi:MAG: Nif3-like dinuclear metal center hexameric protein [Pseudomonadota bacterium]
MIGRDELTDFLDNFLNCGAIKDYCPNGLQVAGKAKIKKIMTGVTACEKLLHAAIAAKVDAIIVHHGYFWKNENPCIVGMKKKRLQLLLANEINLFAYHLPLDVHPKIGNNILLGKNLAIEDIKRLTVGDIDGLVCQGKLSVPMTTMALAKHIEQVLGRQPLVITENMTNIETLAWCSGAGQNFAEQVFQMNVDAYISGEVSEQTTHVTREYGKTYFAAGHHATEKFAVNNLGNVLQEKFAIQHVFKDIANPV